MNNYSTYSNDTFDKVTGLTAKTKIALYSILLAWSLLGNVLVMAVVFWNKNLRTNFNYLIINMTVSDLIIPLLAIPLLIAQVTSELSERPYEWLVDGPFGNALCKLLYFFIDLSPLVSSLSLVVIALHRFIAVVYPERRQIISQKASWILISFTWILSITICSKDFYTFRLTEEWEYNECINMWEPVFDDVSSNIVFFSIFLVVGFVTPLISNIMFYSIIQYKLEQHLKNVIALIEKRSIRSRKQTNRRIFNMSITIIVIFTMCWFPLRVIELLVAFDLLSLLSSDNNVINDICFVCAFLFYLQTAINPCIYFVFLRDFRQGLKNLCSSWIPSQQNP